MTDAIALLAEVTPYQAPEQMSYVVAAWALTVAGIAAYAVHVVRRGRQLSRQVPPDERRWMS